MEYTKENIIKLLEAMQNKFETLAGDCFGTKDEKKIQHFFVYNARALSFHDALMILKEKKNFDIYCDIYADDLK